MQPEVFHGEHSVHIEVFLFASSSSHSSEKKFREVHSSEKISFPHGSVEV